MIGRTLGIRVRNPFLQAGSVAIARRVVKVADAFLARTDNN